MRIILVVSSLLPGGAERVTLGLAEYLRDVGHEPHLFVARTFDSVQGLYVVPDGIPVHRISHGGGNALLRPLLNSVLLRSLVRNVKPDWIISLGAQYKTLALAGCFNKTKILLSERNYPRTFYTKSELEKVSVYYEMADKVVFQTEDERNCFRNLDRGKTAIIPNAVRQDLPCWTGEESRSVAFVGRLVEQKNPMLLIEAFRRFKQTHREWKLDLYGDGPMRDELLRAVHESDLDDSVVFHGNVTAVTEKVSVSGMYVSTSNFEGISNSMLESIAMGVPSVCTDCAGGGARLAIQDGVNGLLIRCGDAVGLAEAMASIADDKEFARRLGKTAHDSARRFAPSSVYPLWVEALS